MYVYILELSIVSELLWFERERERENGKESKENKGQGPMSVVVKIRHYVRIVRRNRRGSGREGFDAHTWNTSKNLSTRFKYKMYKRNKLWILLYYKN